MTRLIDADALFKAYEGTGWYNNADRDEIAERLLLEQPTIDAEPVRHGKWIHKCSGIFVCDKCSWHIGLNVYTEEKASERFKWCPHCGARMDETQKKPCGDFQQFDCYGCEYAERKEE